MDIIDYSNKRLDSAKLQAEVDNKIMALEFKFIYNVRDALKKKQKKKKICVTRIKNPVSVKELKHANNK